MNKTISGFSKRSKAEKIKWLVENFLEGDDTAATTLEKFWSTDTEFQKRFDGFSENTVSNFPIPFGIVPNVKINDKIYAVPMAIEESSVVAAASAGAKYWLKRGGFKTEIIGTTKDGQVHFIWQGDPEILSACFDEIKPALFAHAKPVTENMEKRGGGISDIVLKDFTSEERDYFQLKITFQTCNAMGANFINSVLEDVAQTFTTLLAEKTDNAPMIVMSILSNYTPQCVVRVSVECPVSDFNDRDAEFYAEKFRRAVRIAQLDTYRAVTHNKGIMNGIDAVVLATANDFRAIEACAHAYAARDGKYRSLSFCTIENNFFRFWLEIPLAVGTVGGLTNLHPLAQLSMKILGQPSAEELMSVIATIGLAQNFSALRSLVTTGIQHGHMKMHLTNILHQYQASSQEIMRAVTFFSEKTVSVSAVRSFLEAERCG
jgi:hydroxymethylglutaryl-CoA reductase